jgi:hypothetical protein
MKVNSINPNTMILSTRYGKYLLNYNSAIAIIKNDNSVILSSDWDYSRTTMKRISEFLGQSAKITRQQIEDGVIIIDDQLGSYL